MFYRSTEIDEELVCSFCKEAFIDIVKFIPDCGHCYAELIQQAHETGEFECRVCSERHVMPLAGLSDCKSLSRILKRRRLDKPLSDRARALRSHLDSLRQQLDALGSFDEREHVDLFFDQVELEVREAVESAVRRLNELEQTLVAQIGEYRQRCVQSLDPERADLLRRELTDLTSRVDKFGARWDGFFSRAEVRATEAELEAALDEGRCHESRVVSLRSRMAKTALGGRRMVLKTSRPFFEEPERLGDLISLAVFDENAEEMSLQPLSTHTLTDHSDQVMHALFLANGNVASCSFDCSIIVWSGQDGLSLFELVGHSDYVTALAALPDGSLVSASCDKTVRVWNLEQRRTVRTLCSHTGAVVSLCVLRSGLLATYSLDDSIAIWNPYTGGNNSPLTTMRGHGNACWFIPFGALSNDDLVTCSLDKARVEECVLRVWNPTSGQLLRLASTGNTSVCCLLVLASDEVALSFSNGTIKIVDLVDERLTRSRERAHSWSVTALVQLPNGDLVSSGSDGVQPREAALIKLWRLADLELLQTVETFHNGPVQALCLRRDGSRLASASRDETLKLWSVVKHTNSNTLAAP